MQYLQGETLRDALKRRGALPVAECSEILQQTARGLNAAHKLGIIHRDLKPDNIFLTRGDESELVVKIVDFGIAKLRESATHTQTGMVLGTPAYMSSEQASGMRSDQLDARSDLYSLGIVVYEMLTGRVPFHSDTPLGYLRKHMLEPPPPMRAVAPGLGVSPPVEAVVMKALAKDREERYASALEFAREFARAASAPAPSEELLPTVKAPGSPDMLQAERQRRVQAEAEAERRAREKAEAERRARDQAEQERLAQERAQAERRAAERAEAERRAAEKAEAERQAREQAEQERLAQEKAEAERRAAEKAEAERRAREQAEQERLAQEKAEAERRAAEKAEAERHVREQAEQERLAQEKAEAERQAAGKAEAERRSALPPIAEIPTEPKRASPGPQFSLMQAKKPARLPIAIAVAAFLVVVAAALAWVYWLRPARPSGLQLLPGSGKVRENSKDGLKYVWIPPGRFMMGCSPGDSGCDDDEKPAHQVTITRGFWIGQTPVTVGAYKRFAGAKGHRMPGAPNFNKGWTNENMPIVDVDWNEAHDYCSWAGGRLPTEAEWEYAARAGSNEARYGPIDDIAWYMDNSGRERLDSAQIWQKDLGYYGKRLDENGNATHDVAQKRPNGFGLYDMLGNVWEWANDWHDKNYYRSSPSQDPPGPSGGHLRVLRGGSWSNIPRYVRVSQRVESRPAGGSDVYGFRCGGEVSNP
jgi:formylglycine-generating enzyme required for sulfatase activity